jgi:hypothetical protein
MSKLSNSYLVKNMNSHTGLSSRCNDKVTLKKLFKSNNTLNNKENDKYQIYKSLMQNKHLTKLKIFIEEEQIFF